MGSWVLSAKCFYPYFGVNRQERCNCTETLCNVSFGCLTLAPVSESISYTTCRYSNHRYLNYDYQSWNYINRNMQYCFMLTANPKCSPGYLGKNCRGKCTYPYYGEECQSQCDCDEDSCDVSTGCRNISRGIVL